MNYLYLGFAIITIVVLGVVWTYYNPKTIPSPWHDGDLVHISLGNSEFISRIAVSIYAKQKGLSGSQPLKENEGMLFVFSSAKRHVFWMKGMTFGLDFIWIRENRIVEITKDVLPPTETSIPRVIRPSMSADMVLEIPAGSADKFGIEEGMSISISERKE